MINIIVIVIAVIAILSAVLIPTFGGIVEKANNSADLQEAKNAYTMYLIENDAEVAAITIKVDGGYVKFDENGQPIEVTAGSGDYTLDTLNDGDKYYTVTNGELSDELSYTAPAAGSTNQSGSEG